MSTPIVPPLRLMTFPGLQSGFSVMKPTLEGVRSFVSHNNIVLNYLERGWMRVLQATGYRYELKAGRLAVFWGAVPQKIEAFEPGGIGHSLVLPLGTFLRWPMPNDFTHQLIQGRVFFEPNARDGAFDLALLNRWHPDIASGNPEAAAIVLLELEARLRRLARSCPTPKRVARITPRGPGTQAEKMLLLVAEHFREDLTVADVAAAVNLHPVYAGSLFRHRMGIGLNDYITECRILHAKALLATTDAKLLEVMRDSGFGSVSQFHSVFKRAVGCTPRAYRMGLREPTPVK